ncbi:efflux RND transporter periplasmic adaptor subunit [Veronia pacifica]|uniref:Uncharacterized protein n=1 Tax=Veronia pacifica TaxID=1080227 RepID=A0A1C3E997_9GAMM|nr:efflux RND transporter periplasmic adaptor subunit [Veronia pacifica]ODA29812.1 hypothetical protein A8L45_21675 [Veronia pacifica]
MRRDIYAYLTTATLATALVLSVFLVVSDNVLPFSTQATVKTTSVDVVPEVSGYIEQMYVKQGQHVNPGDTLFTIEAGPFKLAEEKAQASYQQAIYRFKRASNHFDRINTISNRSFTSEETTENAALTVQSAHSAMVSAEADLNLASLNLDKTEVKAKTEGVVTNFASSKGMYASKTASVLHLVGDQQWIDVDFTEKGLRSLSTDDTVNIVYDAIPGKVFRGKIESIEPAMNSGIDRASQLVNIQQETRWIRPQQKVRVRVQPDEKLSGIVAGSRASVMLRGSGTVSDGWMTLLSWFRFVY